MEVMHFKTQRERLNYLKGGFSEIKPEEVVVPKKEEIVPIEATEASEGVSEAKPKKAKKGKKKDDTVQAE